MLESDDDDDKIPSRRRRMAERAADAGEDEEVENLAVNFLKSFGFI